jgi:hypothetical protein
VEGETLFFEVAHLEVEMKEDKGRKVTVALKDFEFPYADLIPRRFGARSSSGRIILTIGPSTGTFRMTLS